ACSQYQHYGREKEAADTHRMILPGAESVRSGTSVTLTPTRARIKKSFPVFCFWSCSARMLGRASLEANCEHGLRISLTRHGITQYHERRDASPSPSLPGDGP